MNIYDFLSRYKKKRTSFQKSMEYKYFIDHRHLLLRMPKYAFLYDSDDNEFDMMRANIILRSLISKDIIEKKIVEISSSLKKESNVHSKLVSELRKSFVDLPYYLEGKTKIYLPIFNRPLNYFYSREPEKLLEPPYDKLMTDFNVYLVDPFDTYGPEIYASLFTRLVLVGQNGKEYAYFHYDTYTIYIINSEGRLDHQIVLFDKWIPKVDKNDLIDRIRPVIDAYFNFDRDRFYACLIESKLVSERAMNLYKRKYGKND
ncbi:MAG: hypothetical protein LUD22_03490 [Coprobacillus sp.]|nr:hypothetical protein [Coprobacillus sp.]